MIHKIILGITCMQSHVNLQTALCSEQAAADVAAKCLLARVNFHVWVQSTLDREAFVAVITLVRSFTRMRANVPDEIAWFTESFRTVLAFISVFPYLFLHYIFLNDQITLQQYYQPLNKCKTLRINANICMYLHQRDPCFFSRRLRPSKLSRKLMSLNLL